MMSTGSQVGVIHPATLAMRKGRSPGGRGSIPGAEVSVSSARRARTRSARDASDQALRKAYHRISELELQITTQQQTIQELRKASKLNVSMELLQKSMDRMHAHATLVNGTVSDGDCTTIGRNTQCYEIASAQGNEVDNEVSDTETVLPPDYYENGGTFYATHSIDDSLSLSDIADSSLALLRTTDEVSFASSNCAHDLPDFVIQQQSIVEQDGTHTVRVSPFTHSHTQTVSSTVDCGEQTFQISSEAASVQTVVATLKTSMAQTDAVIIAEEEPLKTEAHVQTSAAPACARESQTSSVAIASGATQTDASASWAYDEEPIETHHVETSTVDLPTMLDPTDSRVQQIVELLGTMQGKADVASDPAAPHCEKCKSLSNSYATAEELQSMLAVEGISRNGFRDMQRRIQALPFHAWSSLPGTTYLVAQSIQSEFNIEAWNDNERMFLYNDIRDGSFLALRDYLAEHFVRATPKAKSKGKRKTG